MIKPIFREKSRTQPESARTVCGRCAAGSSDTPQTVEEVIELRARRYDKAERAEAIEKKHLDGFEPLITSENIAEIEEGAPYMRGGCSAGVCWADGEKRSSPRLMNLRPALARGSATPFRGSRRPNSCGRASCWASWTSQ